jgi:hypothetical protein
LPESSVEVAGDAIPIGRLYEECLGVKELENVEIVG